MELLAIGQFPQPPCQKQAINTLHNASPVTRHVMHGHRLHRGIVIVHQTQLPLLHAYCATLFHCQCAKQSAQIDVSIRTALQRGL